MNSVRETVSVIIPAYRSETTIPRAVRSALAEPSVIQVIVVDDASGDHTLDFARSADDGTGRLILETQPENKGPAAARNVGLHLAKGDWVALLDADDYWLSGRITRLLDAAQDVDFIADDLYQEIENDTNMPRRTIFSTSMSLPRTVIFSEFVQSNITQARIERAELGFIKPLIRWSFLNEKKISYREDLRLGEDYELYARALAHGARMKIIPACGYVSVVRNNSLSARHTIDDLRRLRDCDADLMKIAGLAQTDKRILSAHARSIDCRLQWRLMIEAVKKRDVSAGLTTFFRPWPVPVYLIQQLWGEAVRRFIKKRYGDTKN